MITAMEMVTQAEPYKPKRTSNACIACRQSKIKCSGTEPYAHKVMVDERYLQQLIEQSKDHQHVQQQPSSLKKRSTDVAFGPGLVDDIKRSVSTGPPPYRLEHQVWTNPFTLPSRTVNGLYKGKSGWTWLAPTSLNLHLESSYRVPSSLNKEVYPLRWRPAPAEEPPDVSGLPSVDDVLYLFSTVKHHLDQHYRFFDEVSITARLHEFHSGNSLQKATENRLWVVHFLLVLAFGNAFLLRSRNTRRSWFPIGQAIRTAQLDGLHTEMPENELGPDTVARCCNLWWTLYVMDRHVSSSLGLPMTTQDSDITTFLQPASVDSRRDTTLSLHIKPTYLFSSILTCKLNEKTELGVFLEKTRTILQTMTIYAREIEDIVHPRTSNSVETMPKGTRASWLRPLFSSGIKSDFKTLQILLDENSLLGIFLPFEMEVTYGAALHLMIASTLFPHSTDESRTSEMVSKGNMLAAARKTELSHLESLFRELAAKIKRSGMQALTLTTPDSTSYGSSHRHDNHHGLGSEPEIGAQDSVSRGAHAHQDQPLDPHIPSDVTTAATTIDPLSGSGMENQAYGPLYTPSSPSLPHLANSAELLIELGISSYEFLSIIDQIGEAESTSVMDPTSAAAWKDGL
ncbi:hypothetical protein BDV06DRAFT_230066 [Aspergillus oleicola]